MIKGFLKAFALFVLGWWTIQYWPVTVEVRSITSEEVITIRMPLKDKRRLEFFFREVCFLNVWAYTLLGNKPMSLDQYTKPWYAFRNSFKNLDFNDTLKECIWPPDFQRICYELTPKELKIKLGLEALNKYLQYFPNSRFFLFTRYRNGNEIVDFRLVDKIKVIETVKNNFKDFQNVLLNLKITPEDLLQKEIMQIFLENLKHDGLLGTLLGFGRDNAWLFSKYHGMDPLKRPMVSAWPEEELINLDQLNLRTQSFQSWELSDLFYPRFACDPDSGETKRLKQIYREEREKIIEYYTGKDIVEATLSLFNQQLNTESQSIRD